jgi:hypothetical protein
VNTLAAVIAAALNYVRLSWLDSECSYDSATGQHTIRIVEPRSR